MDLPNVWRHRVPQVVDISDGVYAPVLSALRSVVGVPEPFFLWVLVAYGLYLMYFGSQYFLKIAYDKVIIFMIMSVLVIVLGVAVAQTLDGIIMGFFVD